MSEKSKIIDGLRDIDDTDWTLSDVYTVIERSEDEGQYTYSELIREYIGETFIKDDETMNDFWSKRLSDGKDGIDFNIVIMNEVLSNGVTFNKPIFANVEGNLENMDTNELIHTLVEMIEDD